MPRMTKAQRKAEADWNNAINWLLNSRHCGDPEIQAAFWGMVDGYLTEDQADSGVGPDGESIVDYVHACRKKAGEQL